ncbi:MAG: ImmA/IrrE family metallo-endopeptidase [Bacteroidota bacterium]
MENLSKRIGYARERARSLLLEFFSAKGSSFPVKIEDLADYFGFEIYKLDSLNLHQRGILKVLSDENRRLIGVNSKHHRHSQKFSVGHELGHFFLSHPSEDDCDDEEIKIYNQEADEFSAELLIPLSILKEKLQDGWTPSSLCSYFDVSEEALWIKIQNQKLLSLIIKK